MLLTGVGAQQGAHVVGWKDRDATLGCDVGENPYAVFWSKLNGSDIITKASFFEEKFNSFVERFTMDETYTLVISDLVVSDEGKYLCQVETTIGRDSESFATLTVNALASDPTIDQCVNTPQRNPNQCTLTPHHSVPVFHLVCRISGFKPNVSLTWRLGETQQVPIKSTEERLSDGTSEKTVTITVSAKNGTDQNFTCTAEGLTVNGTSSTFILVLSLSAEATSSGLSAGAYVAFAIVAMAVICILVLCVLLVLQRHNQLPERVSRILDRSKYLESSEAVNLREKDKRRTDLRKVISNYTIGAAIDITATNITGANINLFGQMNAGKSALINSLHFALKGEYEVMAEESASYQPGGCTTVRHRYPLTRNICLVDNRGLNDFSIAHIGDINQQLGAECGVTPNRPIQQITERECHCAVFVYHYTEHGKNEAMAFLGKFTSEVINFYGRPPMLVLTHADSIGDVRFLKNNIGMFGIPMENIWTFENYTADSHTEDLDKDIHYLQFLLKALTKCDLVISHLDNKRKEIEIIVQEPSRPPREDSSCVLL